MVDSVNCHTHRFAYPGQFKGQSSNMLMTSYLQHLSLSAWGLPMARGGSSVLTQGRSEVDAPKSHPASITDGSRKTDVPFPGPSEACSAQSPRCPRRNRPHSSHLDIFFSFLPCWPPPSFTPWGHLPKNQSLSQMVAYTCISQRLLSPPVNAKIFSHLLLFTTLLGTVKR